MIIRIPVNINPFITRCGAVNESNCIDAGTLYPQRYAKSYELRFITWSEGFEIIDGEKIRSEKGDIFFYEPGTRLQAISPFYCYWMFFEDAFLIEASDLINNGSKIYFNNQSYLEPNLFTEQPTSHLDYSADEKYFELPQKINVSNYEKYLDLFKSIHHEIAHKNSEDLFLIKTRLMQILLMARDEWNAKKHLHPSDRSTNANYPKILKVKEYVDKNIGSNFKLAELAEFVELSSSHLCRKYKELMGESLFDYILKQKLIYAKKLLIGTNLSVKEIVYECGFENDTYFFTVFKKYNGVSPKAFRQCQLI